MKYTLVLLLAAGAFLLTASTTLAVQKNEPVVFENADIASVTVYAEHALVIREIPCQLPQGVSLLKFRNLPENLVEETVQVSGGGNESVKILDVRIFTEFHDEEVNAETRQKKQELLSLEDSLVLEKNRKNILENSLKYLKDIKRYTTTHVGEIENFTPQPISEWEKQIQFQENQQIRIYKEIQAIDARIRDIGKKIEKLEEEIEYFEDESDKETREIWIKLFTETETDFICELSYLTPGAAWAPIYEVRVDLENNTLQLTLRAEVEQNTSEDWSDVALTLSTASPYLDDDVPSMRTWRLSKFDPKNAAKKGIHDPGIQSLLQYTSEVEVGGTAGNYVGVGTTEDDDISTVLADFLESEESSNLSATEFKVPYDVVLRSSYGPQQVSLTSFTVDCHIYHWAMCKLSDTTYLKARAVNKASFPILPGPTMVFLDGKFVARSEIDFRTPGQQMNFLLGPSSRMKVERKLINRFDENVGFGNKEVRRTWEYVFDIENHDSRKQDLVIRDQIPVSGNEEIKVKLLEPRAENVELDENGMMIWRLTLDPGEKRQISFKFQAQFPAGITISGLNQ